VSAPAKFVADASVVIKWYVPEPGSAKVPALLGGGNVLIAPDLLVPELANILWK